MKITVLASAIALAVTAPAAATMIFDGSILSRGASSFFGANAGAFGRYTVASTTTISSFLTLDALGSAANLTFRIYDSTTGALLFTSAAKAFAADASATVADGTFKKSDPLSFTFVPGTTYAVGAVTDNASTLKIGSFATKTEGGVSALLGNQNVFAGVFGTGRACCSIAAQFFTGEAGAVPEPMTWSLLVAGFAMVGVAARRRPVAATA